LKKTIHLASPSFAVFKENGKIRVVTHFRKPNSLLNCHLFPIPKIGNMIRSLEGFSFAPGLDLKMGYYHIKLDADTDAHAHAHAHAQKLCTIVFPWYMGKYKYKSLTISLSKIWNMLRQPSYLDDLLILTNNSF
jgi:hypothetical protein